MDGDTGAESIKCIRFFNRGPDMDVEDFQSYWRERHAPLVSALPSLQRYARYPARLGGYAKGRQPAYDGFDMTWFSSLDEWQHAMGSAEYVHARGDEGNFLANGDCPLITAREYLFIG